MSKQTKSATEGFEQAIARITNRIEELRSELRLLDDTVKKYGFDLNVLGWSKQQEQKRRAAPPLEWLENLMRNGKKTQKEISTAARRANYSGLGAVALLQKNKGKFRSHKGSKEVGHRGAAPVVWSLREVPKPEATTAHPGLSEGAVVDDG